MVERQRMIPPDPGRRSIAPDGLAASFPPEAPAAGAAPGWRKPFPAN
jgi:hypothetical protein